MTDLGTAVARHQACGPVLTVLDKREWAPIERSHQEVVDRLTADHRRRTNEGRTHPVEDFLFTYYPFRPAQLRRWHPGWAIGLLEAGERLDWRFHRSASDPRDSRELVVVIDRPEFLAARASSVQFIRTLLDRTAKARPNLGCFGLHEWAMVFAADDRRHAQWPLRLGRDGTDEVVRAHPLRCSHYDAVRFFTPAAKPLNLLKPDLDTRDRMEQPGCLHATMDLYKWAFRLTPVVSSALVLNCFSLAQRIREVDMRASPYDLRSLGLEPIRIETPAGRAQYVAAQREFADAGQLLRARLQSELDGAFGPRESHQRLTKRTMSSTTHK